MQKKPLVSVIMNCLNCEQYLIEAIDSVYAQTYDNWEIIFWDNGSCDGSEHIAKSYDSKLKYFKSEVTSVLGTARVSAIERAKGEYFAFLDCDDIWFKDKLDRQMKIFFEDGENLALVYGRCEVLYENNNEKVINQDTLLEGEVFGNLAKENFIPFVSAVVKSEFFHSSGGFPINIKHSTDYWLFLNIAKDHRVRAIQETCCTYRYHSENLSSKNRILAAKEAIQIVSMFLPDKAAKNGLKYHYDNLTIAYIKEFLILESLNNLFKHGGLFRIFFKIIYKINRLIKAKL
jgi:glycosyltransferase involved in cell wall biosynthesis